MYFYNQRGEASENRIKELRSDFSGAQLPCGDFGANAVAYFKLCVSRQSVGAAATITAGCLAKQTGDHDTLASVCAATQIVCHGRQWILKLNRAQRQLIDEALWSIRNRRLW